MRIDQLAALPLVCPACRRRADDGDWSMHTLSLTETSRSRPGDPLEIEQGILRCDNAGCHRRYPIIDGIPIILRDLPTFLSSELGAVVESDLDPQVAGLLALAGPDDAPYARLLEHLSIYLDAHWGDRAAPYADGPIPGAPDASGQHFGLEQLANRLRGRAGQRVKWAVELGASCGRGIAELAAGADHVIGVDLHFGALRRARRLLLGERLSFARRASGRHYLPARITPGDRTAPQALLLCADALDPPLVPGAFGRVVALNLLDAVHHPPRLLDVMEGLCGPGGELCLASPYAWNSAVVAEEDRLGPDPAADVRRRLAARFTVEDEAELLWWLRRDDRSGHAYTVHWLRAKLVS